MIRQTASEQMYLSTVEEESGSRDNGIWERRRHAIVKNKRMVKLKDKDKVKVKPCKTIIIEEETSSCSPSFWEATGGCDCAAIPGRNWSRHWSLAVLHCAKLGFSPLELNPLRCSLLGHNLRSFVGSVSSRVFFLH